MHAVAAAAIWGQPWWGGQATDRQAPPAIDINADVAPAKPEVETIGAAGMPRLGDGRPSALEVTVVRWPAKPEVVKPKPARPARPPTPKPPPPTPTSSPPAQAVVAHAGSAPATSGPADEAAPEAPASAVGAGPAAGPGVAPVMVTGVGNASFATGANLLAYAPPSHIVAVYVRLAALRDTPWEPLAEAVLRPLPDYRTLLGGGAKAGAGTTAARMLDAIFISSFSPRRVDATMLAARLRVTREVLRASLAQGERVTWSAVRGGVKGVRPGGDGRLFFAPAPDVMMLARARDLGDLLAPATAGAEATPPGTASPEAAALDAAVGEGPMPPWLVQQLSLEAQVVAQSPAEAAPVIMLTGAVKPSPLWSELLASPGLVLPQQVTASMVMAPTGFVIRGNLVFAEAGTASDFRTAVEARQAAVLSDMIAATVMARLGAKHAVTNLSLKQTDRVLAFSTSVSSLDAQKLLGVAAVQLASYFAAQPGE